MGREEEKFDVYVANALFSDADQAFNSMLASKLRDQDLQVFCPKRRRTTKVRHQQAKTFSFQILKLCCAVVFYLRFSTAK